MANRDFTPVMFGLEKNIVHLSAHITFGAAGAATVDAINSKGILAMNQASVSFTATGTSTTSITAVSSFVGLYNGMILSGTNVAANSVISAINAGAGTFTVSNATTGAITSVTATGGYQLQLGVSKYGATALDPYNKLMGLSFLPDMSGLQGAVSTAASSPNAPHWFMSSNTIASATAVTGASLNLQCGYYTGNVFTSVQPVSGSGLYIKLMLCNSTAK